MGLQGAVKVRAHGPVPEVREERLCARDGPGPALAHRVGQPARLGKRRLEGRGDPVHEPDLKRARRGEHLAGQKDLAGVALADLAAQERHHERHRRGQAEGHPVPGGQPGGGEGTGTPPLGALGRLGQVEPGAERRPGAADKEDALPGILLGRGHRRDQLLKEPDRERVALVRPVEGQDGGVPAVGFREDQTGCWLHSSLG